MKNKTQNKEITNFIKIIRESFHDSVLVYHFGGCFGFYRILKFKFPKAIPYFEDKERQHILTKIGNDFYDIKGKCFDVEPIKLTKKDIEEWENMHLGQRLEIMLAKYQRQCNNLTK